MIVLVNDRNSGITHHRLVEPFRALAETNKEVGVAFFRRPNDIPSIDATHLVFNRGLGMKPLHDLLFLTKARKAGLKIIMDIDDYWELPEHHTIRWRKDVDYVKWKMNIEDNMYFADVFWTSTEELKTKIQERFPDKETIVVKNALRTDQWYWTSSRPIWDKNDGKVHIGYVGGHTHYKDLDHIKQAVARINKYHNKKVVWHQCGYDNRTEHGKRVSNQIRYILTSNGKYYRNYQAHYGLSFQEYQRFYDGLDISIAPLIDNDFNSCKSELKVIEAGYKKVAFVGEDMVTYRRAQEYCDLELAHTTDQWYESIMHYVNNPDELQQYKYELHEQVKAYDIHKENDIRLKSLLSLY